MSSHDVKNIMRQALGRAEVVHMTHHIKIGVGAGTDHESMIIAICSLDTDYNVRNCVCFIQTWKLFLESCDKGELMITVPPDFAGKINVPSTDLAPRKLTVTLPKSSQEQMATVKSNPEMIPVLILALIDEGEVYPIYGGIRK